MKKKIHINLDAEQSIDKDLYAIIDDNKIVYQEENVNVTITKFENYIEMKRECNEYIINLILKEGKTISHYQVFGADKVFDLETNTTQLIVDDNGIIANYNLEGNQFSFKLEVIS